MFNREIILTEEQQEVVNKCIEFIDSGNPDEWFLISGKAGTGKTTIIRKVLKSFKTRPTIVSALSHKAKKVIAESIRIDHLTCKPFTIAGMLGMTLDQETGKFQRDFKNKQKPQISTADIVIIDEASMLNEEAIKLIFEFKRYNAKIICLGDIGQLEPIREEKTNKPSPIFETVNKLTLTKRIRQGENHPVLTYADYYWENSQKEIPREYPVPDEARFNAEKEGSKISFHTDIEEIYSILDEKFRYSLKHNDPNYVKIITYRNFTRKIINNHFHEILFKNPTSGLVREFNVGELIIFNDTYEQGTETIENSSEYQIKRVMSSATMITGESLKIYGLDIDIHDNSDQLITVTIQVLAESSKDAYNKYISSLFKIAKDLPPKTDQRIKALNTAWEAKNKYADIDYGYAITSHKCQGSTYDSVVVMENDIMATAPISAVTKSRSIYTALTRARKEVFVIY